MFERSITGLTLRWDDEGLGTDELRAALPVPCELGDFGGESVVVEVRLRPWTGPRLRRPDDPNAVAVLHHAEAVCYTTDDGFVIYDRSSRIDIVDDGRRVVGHIHPDALEHARNFSTSTVLIAVLIALRYHQRFHLHAGAARFGGGPAWILPGDANAGKSTTTMSLFTEGAEWLSDDVLLLQPTDSGTRVVAWPRQIRMTHRTAAGFPELEPLLVPCVKPSTRDVRVDPRAAFPGRFVAFADAPTVLLFPRVEDRDRTEIERLDGAESFGRLLPACAWALLDHLPRRAEHLQTLKGLVDQSAGFALRLGRDMLDDRARAVRRIRAAVADVSAST